MRYAAFGGMGTGHGHDVCNQPPVTLQMSNTSPILKWYCRDHVPSAAESGPSGGWSSVSTRFGAGQLAAEVL